VGQRIPGASVGALTSSCASTVRAALLALGACAASVLSLGVASATAVAADTCSNAAVRAAQGTEYLAGCRALELVTPVDKGAANAQVFNYPEPSQGIVGPQGSAIAGDAVWWSTFAAVPTSTNGANGFSGSYLSRRTGAGWSTVFAGPPFVEKNPLIGITQQMVYGASENLDRLYLNETTNIDPLDTDGAGESTDVYERLPDGSFTWHSRENGAPTDGFATDLFAGNSADGSTVAFSASQALVPADASRTGGQGLYISKGGVRTLVSELPNGSPVNDCGATLGNASNQDSYGAISANGQRIVFSVPDPYGYQSPTASPDCLLPQQVYVRDGDDIIKVGSPTLATRFRGGSADGSKILISSLEGLTPDASTSIYDNLYLFDVAQRQLTLVATDFLGMLDMSSDGRRTYFVSTDQLDEDKGVAGQPNAYVYVDGAAHFIATLAPTTNDTAYAESRTQRLSRISPDGTKLLFGDPVSLGGAETGGKTMFYLYDATTGTIRCVSCRSDGQTPTADAQLRRPGTSYLNRNVTDDGHVFFNSLDPLVPRDVNGKVDAYEYNDGEVHLLSDGTSSAGAGFVDAGRDGRDVFIGTASSLLDEDIDGGQIDIYDVRRDGGFPVPAPPAPACTGDSCHSSAGPPSRAAGAASATKAGDPADEPVARAVRPSLRVAKVSQTSLRQLAATGRLSVRVRATTPQKITARLRASIGGFVVTAASASGKARSGSVTLTLRMAAAARAQLNRKGRMSLKLVVSQPGATTQSSSLILTKKGR
jgi:hypothetical protein